MDKGVMGEARKAVGRRILRLGSFPYAVFGMALVGTGAFLSGCFGGSDGVENPKMEFDFSSEAGSPSAGRVALYGQGVNPVDDNLPLASKDFAAGAKVTFTPEEMDLALKQAMARGGKDSSALRDTTVHFNLIAVSGDLETYVPGFSYRRSGKTFGFFKTEGKVNGSINDVIGHYKMPKAVKGFKGRLGLGGILRKIDHIFVPGSPYQASIDEDSTFTMPQMSPGSYNIIGTETESKKLFISDDTLNTSDSAYSAKAWDTITFIPDGN
jgi:hypothetical protein